jgi:hypothetical protein
MNGLDGFDDDDNLLNDLINIVQNDDVQSSGNIGTKDNNNNTGDEVQPSHHI